MKPSPTRKQATCASIWTLQDTERLSIGLQRMQLSLGEYTLSGNCQDPSVALGTDLDSN